CRKQTEGNAVLRCEGRTSTDTSQHHWREGNLASAARCEVCRRSCGSSDVLAGMRCEWCSITVRTSQSQRSLPHRGSDALSRSAHSVRKHEWLLSTVLQKKKNDKNLALGADVCPLLVFVNPKSGGLKGRELLYSFRKLLNPHQVFDISNGGPLAGTCKTIKNAETDRCGNNSLCLSFSQIVQMNNYFGIGIDAELSLDFHLAREDEPDKFTSRFHNKGVYVKVGLQKISHTRSLHKELQLQVDAQNVALPNIEGLIFLNIPRYWGSGADLWGSEGDGRFGKPSIDDGLLEVVGVTGVVHMGQVQSGLRSGIRIAQGNYIRLTVSKPIPVQVDGEPWIQPPGHIIISAAGPKVRLFVPAGETPEDLQDSRSSHQETTTWCYHIASWWQQETSSYPPDDRALICSVSGIVVRPPGT
uniref:diacylglycerol kinase (ATP) n=1 Tax=Stegastes partitus TaxID=144197 RepID=A0A3B5BE18_9TELE